MAKKPSKRGSIGKTVRFEVFKRDSFTCQYCGNTPPAVVLELDHVIPVSGGGSDDIDNLLTACFDCNRGKGARQLGQVPATVAEKMALAEERAVQLKAYEKMLNAARRRLLKAVDEVVAVYEARDPGYTLTESARSSIERFLKKLPLPEVIEAMEKALLVKPDASFKYFCGICWNKIKRGGSIQ